MIPEGQASRTSNLTASGDGFSATLETPIASGARIVVTGRMPDGHTVQARYVMPWPSRPADANRCWPGYLLPLRPAAAVLSPLSNLTCRHLSFAQVLSLLATGLATVVLGLLAFKLAGADAEAVLGTALDIKMIAYVDIAPVAGAFAHLVPRRTLLVTLDLLRAAVALCLPFVTEVWQVYVLIFVLQSGSAAFTLTFQATMPDILPEEAEYTKALSLPRLAYDLEALASPAIAAALLGVIGFHWVFGLNALGFLASATLVLSVVLPSPKPATTERGAWGRMTRGVRIYLVTPRLQGLLALNLSVAAAGAMVIVNTVVLVRAVFGLGDRDVA